MAFSLKKRINSFRYAAAGIGIVVKSQHNAWIHLVASLGVIGAGVYFDIERDGWLWIIVAMALVWMAEALNTAVELLADAITSEYHPLIKKAKDVAAGAVLFAAIGAAAIGLAVFFPYLMGGG